MSGRSETTVAKGIYRGGCSLRGRMVRVGWDALAAWRDSRMSEEGDLWHRALIDPTLLRVVGSVRGLRILDLACGNGYLTRRWARQGAKTVVGVEASRPTLGFARRREQARPSGARFLERDASNLEGIPDAAFDLVVANMALQDIRDAAGTVKEVARVLAPHGRFVFSVSHPCFDLDDRSAWVVERMKEHDGTFHDVVWRKVRQYRDERTVRVPWRISEDETGSTIAYHRTLATYARILREAGLAIVRLEEPSPLPGMIAGSPQGRFIAEIPLHLVVEARAHPALPSVRKRSNATKPASRTSGRTPRKAGRRSGSGGRTRGSSSGRRGSRTGS
jgi:ubiquinone/menaquinone biosynthesis C-methylase UbiE